MQRESGGQGGREKGGALAAAVAVTIVHALAMHLRGRRRRRPRGHQARHEAPNNNAPAMTNSGIIKRRRVRRAGRRPIERRLVSLMGASLKGARMATQAGGASPCKTAPLRRRRRRPAPLNPRPHHPLQCAPGNDDGMHTRSLRQRR
eukprot:355127-Chlamydomonas_euryale.AAC.3